MNYKLIDTTVRFSNINEGELFYDTEDNLCLKVNSIKHAFNYVRMSDGQLRKMNRDLEVKRVTYELKVTVVY